MELLGTRTGQTHTWHNQSLGARLELTRESTREVLELATELVGLLLVGRN
jgi:hypothetical protein